MCTSISGARQLGTRIAQRHRRVGQRAGVEDHRLAGIGGGVDPVQQLGLAVALPHNGFQAKLGRLRARSAPTSSSWVVLP